MVAQYGDMCNLTGTPSEVQRRLFGEEGRPGGKLLTALLRMDSETPAPARTIGRPKPRG